MTTASGLAGLFDAARALRTAAPADLELGRPWLLLTVVAVALCMGALALSRARPSLAFSRAGEANDLPKGRGHVVRWVAFAASALALLLMALASAEPRVVGEPDPGTTEGIDLVVSLDVSG